MTLNRHTNSFRKHLSLRWVCSGCLLPIILVLLLGCAGGGTAGTGGGTLFYGAVLGDNGEPLPNTTVTVTTTSDKTPRVVTTDADGNFSVENLDVSSSDSVNVRVQNEEDSATFEIPPSRSTSQESIRVQVDLGERNSQLQVLPSENDGDRSGDSSGGSTGDPGNPIVVEENQSDGTTGTPIDTAPIDIGDTINKDPNIPSDVIPMDPVVSDYPTAGSSEHSSDVAGASDGGSTDGGAISSEMGVATAAG